MATASYGGHDYSFVDKKLEKFTCNTICTKVLRDPHLTKCCGQSVCESCLNYWFTKHRKESCPHCRAEGEEFQHFQDKRLKREIDSLRIHCTHKEEGCQWLGELGSLKDHLESPYGCGYYEVECPNKCMTWETTGVSLEIDKVNIRLKKLKRKELEGHLKNDCYHRPYQCEYCGLKDTYQRITGCGLVLNLLGNHYDECPEFPMKCTNKCTLKDIKRKDIEGHRNQCLKEPLSCPFEEAGCKVNLIRRELEQHLATTQQQHLLMVMGAYKEMKQASEELKHSNTELKQANSDIKKELEDHEKQITELTRELAQLQYSSIPKT